MMPFFWLSMAVVVGCIVACIEKGTAPAFVLRGMAVTCLLPCTIIVGHWMLRRDMGGFKWMLISHYGCGSLCQTGNIEHLVAELNRCIADAKECVNKGIRVANRVRAELSLASVWNELRRNYNKLRN